MEVVRQVTKGIVSAAKGEVREISVQLVPRHLGKVQISVEIKADVMTGRIAVENDTVRAVVETHLGQLREAIEAQNIRLESLEVTVGQEKSFLAGRSGREGRGYKSNAKGNRKSGPEQTDNKEIPFPKAETGRRWGYNTMELVA
jgi:flagellar hook-length control protein FliK